MIGVMHRGFCVLLSLGIFAVPTLAHADDALYKAVSDYLIKWKDFKFEGSETVSKAKAQQEPRYSELHVKGLAQRAKGQFRWSYEIAMSDDYKYPLPGELNPPKYGKFIQLPVEPAAGTNDRAWQQAKPGSKWEKASPTTETFATKLAMDIFNWPMVMDSAQLLKAKPSAKAMPVFGAKANEGKKGLFYEIKEARPKGYRFGYWVDPSTRQLLQITVEKSEFGELHDFTIGFWDVNKSNSPVITGPTS